MEQAATETKTETAPAEKTFKQKFAEKFRVARSVAKGALGAGSLVLGALLVGAGTIFPVLLGAVTLYTGGRSVFEAGKELLPLKAQSAISKFFTGKELTAITPVEPPKTVLGKIVRYVEFAALAVAGFAGVGAGAFSMGFGDSGAKAVALLYGGAGIMAGAASNLVDRAVRDTLPVVKRFIHRNETPSVGSANSSVPERAPKSTLRSRLSGLAFNASAEMAVLAQPVVPQQPKPPAATPPQA